MTRSMSHAPYLTASVVLQTSPISGDVAQEARIAEGLTVLAKAIEIFKNENCLDVSYEVEIVMQDNSIILTGRLMSRPTLTPKVHLTAEEMHALFDMHACIN